MLLLTQSKNGISAMALHRHLGMSYHTVWLIKHKLMQAMKERDDHQPLWGFKAIFDLVVRFTVLSCWYVFTGIFNSSYPGMMPGYGIGGGGGTAGPYLSIRAGLYLHPVARMRGVLFAAFFCLES